MEKKTLPFVTWMDPEDTILSEISQRKENTVYSHLHVESKKGKLMEIESRKVVTR